MESNKYESLYSAKVKAGRRRTYFFDVRKTKGDDYYITLTESTRKFNEDGYERHKIFLYKEDFNRFMEGLNDVVDHVKTELMPDYDYDEFAKRYEEGNEYNPASKPASGDSGKSDSKDSDADMDDDMSW